jgi:hypothetical protein
MGRGSGSNEDGLTVTEGDKAHYSAHGVMGTDSNIMSDTPPPAARWGVEAPEVTLRPAAAPASDVPDIRKSARKAEEVERERGREWPWWFGPAVGVVSFVVVLGAGIVGMTMWFSYLVATRPEPEPPPEVPEDLEGVPVRKGIGEGR